ncbi:inward rectifier potassium channel 16-like [Genypterus blacodes]|uniref:inward rectifier potassium channel 16-like n=1 Tax=Genypterus blacodes TaxID=154954 RepID=UPI003F767139
MGSEGVEHIAIDTHHTALHPLGRRNATEPRRMRYMQKDGRFPVTFQKAPGEWSPYLMDIYTTLVEFRWRVMFLIFSLSYILSWLLFGLCYWLMAYVNGDISDVDSEPCVYNVHSFSEAFMFSLETQATIGYGFRGMTENCMVAIVVLTIQSVLSCFLDTIIIGIVIAKMASARKRAQTVGFSNCAVVNLRNGVLCLSWRLGDFRGNHMLEGVVKAQLIRYVRKAQGSVVVSHQDLDIQDRDIVLVTPATIIHRLEHGSPLYSLGPEELLEEDFELVVSFTYTDDSVGMLHQTRTSYTPADIRWGQRFQDVFKQGKKRYQVDYGLFNVTSWVQTPGLSAKEYDRGRPPAESIESCSGFSPTVERWRKVNTTTEIVLKSRL